MTTAESVARALRDAHNEVCQWIDERRRLVLAVIGIWFSILLVVIAHGRALWHDEVYTILTAQLPILAFWRAALDGIDYSPPLNTLLTHALQLFVAPGPIVSRLPPIIAFVIGGALLATAVGRRTNAVTGLLAMFIFAATPAWTFATEARGYALSASALALALYAWTEASAGRRPTLHWVLLGIGVAAGVWAHYYSIVAVFPIVVAEATRQMYLRKFVISPWIALTMAALATLPLWPLAAVAGASRSTFWANTGAPKFGDVYNFPLIDLRTHRTILGWLLLIIASELVRRAIRRQWPRRLPVSDLVAAASCCALPAAVWLISYMTGVYTERYLTFTTAGIAFGLPVLLWTVLPAIGIGEWMVLVALVIPVMDLSRDLAQNPPLLHQRIDDHPLLGDWLNSGKSIAVTGGVDFLGLWYSVPENKRPQIAHLADPESELFLQRSDTVDRGYLALSRWTPVPVVRVKPYAKTHAHFLLYAYENTWPFRTLEGLGASILEIGRESSGNGVLYEVTMPVR